MDETVGKARLACRLAHFGEIKDPREPAKVRYLLPEVLLLVVAATIAGCDDDDEIADGGRRMSISSGVSRNITLVRRAKIGYGC